MFDARLNYIGGVNLLAQIHKEGGKSIDFRSNRGILTKKESGRNFSTDVIGAICAALEVEPDEIMEFVPDKENNKSLIRLTVWKDSEW